MYRGMSDPLALFCTPHHALSTRFLYLLSHYGEPSSRYRDLTLVDIQVWWYLTPHQAAPMEQPLKEVRSID